MLAVTADAGPLTPLKAIILGAVEGITEFLPISSTGHLLVTQRLLDLGTGSGKAAADTYAIAIQIGAIMAVVAVSFKRLVQMANGVVGRDQVGRDLLRAADRGVRAGGSGRRRVRRHDQGASCSDRGRSWPHGSSAASSCSWWRPGTGATALEQLTIRNAAIIGCAQILALWPGTSRSLVTMIAALAIGMSMAAAVEFSFLLGLATLSAATVLDLAKDGDTLLDLYGWQTPLLGTIVAFVTALIAVRWFVAYLRTSR